jgi:hypothetical protein
MLYHMAHTLTRLRTYLGDDIVPVMTVVVALALMTAALVSAPLWYEPSVPFTPPVEPAAVSAPDATWNPPTSEDDPRWDCTQDGNRQCGAIVVDHEEDGSPIVRCPAPDPVWVGRNGVDKLVCEY